MPYIKPEIRDIIEDKLYTPMSAGELNYLITKQCLRYLQSKPLSYALINDVIGALECAKQEFYRRIALPYEIEKIKENGDVYY